MNFICVISIFIGLIQIFLRSLNTHHKCTVTPDVHLGRESQVYQSGGVGGGLGAIISSPTHKSQISVLCKLSFLHIHLLILMWLFWTIHSALLNYSFDCLWWNQPHVVQSSIRTSSAQFVFSRPIIFASIFTHGYWNSTIPRQNSPLTSYLGRIHK